MTNKQKELRKQRIKDILLKSLHLICYILSLLFILVCIVGGVKSCSNNNTPNNTNNINLVLKKRYSKKRNLVNVDVNDYLVYKFKFDTNFSYDDGSLKDYFSVPTESVSVDAPQISYDVILPNASVIINNNLVTIDRFSYVFASLPSTIDRFVYYYDLYRVYVYGDDNSIIPFVYRTGSTIDDFHYSGGDFQILLNDNPIDNFALLQFLELTQPSSFIFNQQFNYNAPLNTNINGVYGTGSFTYVGSDSAYITYDVGYFLSNGQLFNSIKVWFFATGAIDVMFSDGVGRAPSGYYVYGMMQYINTLTNNSVIVNVHDQVPFKTSGGGYTYYYANSSTWKNDGYRYLTFLETLPNSLVVSINAFNNNNQSYYSGQIYSDGGDVFTLLSYGFSSLSSFWSLNILPGISLGVLFFLPAVVGIIITIVHLLRK